jgi:hypothetical protein
LTEERVLGRTSNEGFFLVEEQVLAGMSDEDGVLNEADDEEDDFASWNG